MMTREILSGVMRLVVATACVVASASCGSELLRTGRSPMFLTVVSLQAAKGDSPSTFATPLLSDVQTLVDVTTGGTTTKMPTIYNDLGSATMRVNAKDQSGGPTAPTTTSINAITVNRYRVEFRRSDGRNTPGVDVPFGFDGAVSVTIQPNSEGQVIFDLVRHSSKSEPPLRNLIGGGSLRFIATIAEVTFYGRDQNGNEVIASATIDVTFADFGDE